MVLFYDRSLLKRFNKVFHLESQVFRFSNIVDINIFIFSIC